MNVFHEEEGSLKVSAVLADQGTSLQVESIHGKRGKVKAGQVLLRFERPAAAELLAGAEALLPQLDPDFLWACCAQDAEFGFEDLAAEFFGQVPTATQSVAVALCLHGAPMYFYKRGKGRYRPATPDNLKAAKAGLERKAREEAQRADWLAQLAQGHCPEALSARWRDHLFRPDRNSLEVKALEAAAAQGHCSVAQLYARCGVLASPRDFHRERFVYEWFGPAGEGPPPPPPVLDTLPAAAAPAFSIDDATTTEIDDAFSLQPAGAGLRRLGIHIAAPALGFRPDSALDTFARERLSTVYMPGDKFTMLPDSLVAQYTLAEGRWCPAVSLYLDVREDDHTVVAAETRIEKVQIAANLRHGDLEHGLQEEALQTRTVAGIPWAEELTWLWHFANTLARQRGHVERQPVPVDYTFQVQGDQVQILQRVRGNPIDRIVSELMIHVNQHWGGVLAGAGVPGLFRTQVNGRTGLGTEPLPHQGLGVAQYAWSSSPLRRYVDLVNQWQLLAHLRGEAQPWPAGGDGLGSIARSFETAYDTYNEFQRTMERYWSLRWLIQENVRESGVTMLRDGNGKVWDTPLVVKVHGAQDAAPGTRLPVELGVPDLWALSVSCQVRGGA